VSFPIEGTISAKPFHDNNSGTIHGSVGRRETGSIHGSIEHRETGTIHGSVGRNGSLSADVGESPENSAVAEVGNLISSLGTLSAQAQMLPLTAPTLPGLPQGGYQAQPTDYMQLAQDAD
jgi:hypothetical protein